MGAWSLTAGLVLLVVFLNIQDLDANRRIFPDFRQNEAGTPENKINLDFLKCLMKWYGTLGVSCNGTFGGAVLEHFALILNYTGDAFGTELKKIFSHVCQQNLTCSGNKCECEDPSKDSPSCKSTFPKQDLKTDCESQSKAYVSSARQDAIRQGLTGPALHITRGPPLHITFGPGSPGEVSRKTGYFPYIILMAIILFILATN